LILSNDVMALVKECGAVPTPEDRFGWLRRKYEWMTRNDVPK
jgi:hypothetical protein